MWWGKSLLTGPLGWAAVTASYWIYSMLVDAPSCTDKCVSATVLARHSNHVHEPLAVDGLLLEEGISLARLKSPGR